MAVAGEAVALAWRASVPPYGMPGGRLEIGVVGAPATAVAAGIVGRATAVAAAPAVAFDPGEVALGPGLAHPSSA